MNLNVLFIISITVWAIIWKGVALWKSAKDGQRNWFIAILVLNSITIGILEIVYLFFFAKKPLTLKSFSRLKFWNQK